MRRIISRLRLFSLSVFLILGFSGYTDVIVPSDDPKCHKEYRSVLRLHASIQCQKDLFFFDHLEKVEAGTIAGPQCLPVPGENVICNKSQGWDSQHCKKIGENEFESYITPASCASRPKYKTKKVIKKRPARAGAR